MRTLLVALLLSLSEMFRLVAKQRQPKHLRVYNEGLNPNKISKGDLPFKTDDGSLLIK